MKLGHLSKVVEKRASNIARRQKREAQRNDHYNKADGIWEIMNPEEFKEFRKEEKASIKEAKRNAALKLAMDPDAEISSDADGRKVIVDFADIDKAKRELAAAAILEEDLEEDTLADFAMPSPVPPIPGAALPAAKQETGKGAGQKISHAHPPRGAVVYPVASETSLLAAIQSLRERQTLWLEAGRHKWEPKRKSSKDQAVEFEDQRMRMLTDWEYEPLDDRARGVLLYDDYLKTYHALDPVRPTLLPSMFSETTLREIRPRFEGFDPERFLHIESHGVDLRGAPHPCAAQFPNRQTFPLTQTRGQWLLGANSSGTRKEPHITHKRVPYYPHHP